jgi:hypothetical protein
MVKLIPLNSGHRAVRRADLIKHKEKHGGAKWICQHWLVYCGSGNECHTDYSKVKNRFKISVTCGGTLTTSTLKSISPQDHAADHPGNPFNIEKMHPNMYCYAPGTFHRDLLSMRLFSSALSLRPGYATWWIVIPTVYILVDLPEYNLNKEIWISTQTTPPTRLDNENVSFSQVYSVRLSRARD